VSIEFELCRGSKKMTMLDGNRTSSIQDETWGKCDYMLNYYHIGSKIRRIEVYGLVFLAFYYICLFQLCFLIISLR
jgi:hypothetical protein